MHTMVCIEQKSPGVSYWVCQKCGRTLLIRFKPYARMVVVAGDDSVQHTGSIGGIQMVADVEQEPSGEDLEWLESAGIEWK